MDEVAIKVDGSNGKVGGNADDLALDESRFARKRIWARERLRDASIPNMYKTLNRRNNGFDTGFLALEKGCTVFAGVIIATSIVGCVVWYSKTEVLSGGQEWFPTLDSYEAMLKVRGLVGRPECDCASQLIPWGSQYGGVVSDIHFNLDGLCGNDGKQPLSGLAREQKTFVRLSEGVSGEGRKTFVCSDEAHAVGAGTSQTSLADCAIVRGFFAQALQSLDEACKSAQLVHEQALENFMQEYFASPKLHGRDVLAKLAMSTLDAKAFNNGLIIYSGAAASTFHTLDDPRVTIGALLASGVLPTTDYRPWCKEYEVGHADALTPPLRSALLQCNHSGRFTGRCCSAVPKPGSPCDGEERSLTCGETMMELAARVASSAYPAIVAATKVGLMQGMDIETREKKLAAGQPPPRPKRALSTSVGSDSGGYIVKDSSTEMFDRYYHLCGPTRCMYTTFTLPDLRQTVLIVSGLIGGIVAAGRVLGQCMTSGAKFVTIRLIGGSSDAEVGVARSQGEAPASPKAVPAGMWPIGSWRRNPTQASSFAGIQCVREYIADVEKS
jgi:hypothetical protein